MGLTFPREPYCLCFQCCCLQRWRLGGASVSQRSLSAAISLQPLSLMLVFVMKMHTVLHMESQAACLREAASLYYQLSASFWYESYKIQLSLSHSHISNSTGTTPDEQDEFAVSVWPNHCQTPHGKLECITVV